MGWCNLSMKHERSQMSKDTKKQELAPAYNTTRVHESSFDIRTPRDFLHRMILPQYEDFIGHNASTRYALLAFIVVYHMYEWVNPRKKFTKEGFQSLYPSDPDMAATFDLARGIVNGTKHFKPTGCQHRPKTHMQTGFSSAFSDGFARPLNIEAPDGTSESVDILLRKMDFWKRQEQLGSF